MADQIELKSIDVNGAVLHYVEQGSGQPLVLVHGSLSDYRTWAPQVEAFADRYHVIAYSRRFHYPNTWPGGEPFYAVDTHAADLAALVEALGLGPAYLVGHSYGAATSLTMALRHPELVGRLVLAEPPILPWLERLPDGPALLAAFLANACELSYRAFESGDRVGGVRIFIEGVSGRGAFERVPPASRNIQMDNASVLQAEMGMIARFGTRAAYFADPACASLGQVHIPTLLVAGERSPVMFHLILDELARCLPQTQRVTIPNASHSMVASNPLAFNQAVLEFLGK